VRGAPRRSYHIVHSAIITPMHVLTFNHETVDTISPLTEGPAPDFSITDTSGRQITLSALEKPVVISIFPDIKTPVCSTQTRFFNEEAARRDDIHFLSVSNNEVAELKNWCAAEGVDMSLLPDDGTFGDKYRLRMFGGPLPGRLARSIYVIKNGKIEYAEIVPEITDEPDYHAALAVASELA